MWIVCITSVRHVLTVNGYGGRQTKENEKSWCFKGWETLVIYHQMTLHTCGCQIHLDVTKIGIITYIVDDLRSFLTSFYTYQLQKDAR